MENPRCFGVKFCNGLDNNGNYSPAMCTITGKGDILEAFDTNSIISVEEFETCRSNWQEKYPTEKGFTQFFYLGTEAIEENIKLFDVDRYEAAFVEDQDGENTAVLFGYEIDGMKDPGDPGTALNDVYICPPRCEGP